MKQNEKFLVYAVTGFLVVILMIAVIFGKEGPRRDAPGTGTPAPKDLSAVLDKNKAMAKPDDAAKGNENKSTDGSTPLANQKPEDAGNRTGLPSADRVLPDRPLVVQPPPAPPATLADKLGPSRVEGFGEQKVRYVRVRSGDTLSALVQRWCGSEPIHMDRAQALNEDLAMLKAGDEVPLPFVADEIVLAAWQARQPQPQPAVKTDGNGGVPAEASGAKPEVKDPAVNPPATPLPANVRIHEVKPGEMLWKIAVAEVGDKLAPKFIATVKELNPDVKDFDRLKVGQKLKFPPK